MIRYETRFTPALPTGLVGPDSKSEVLHRWVCTCGRKGVWLRDLKIVERNAAFHGKWHLDNPNVPVHPTQKEAS